jgi:dTDP-4-amino-4,6-dideoxygalactose transaminase
MTVGGDGGMITTNEPKLARKVSKLRDCGRKSQYIHDTIGYTSRLNSVNAAVGRVQLRRLDEWNEKRRHAAGIYDRLLSDIDSLILPPLGDADGIQPVFPLYVIRTILRESLKTWLESNGISCGIHYVLPIHLQPIYKKLFGFKKGLYPKSEELCKTCLSIPIYPELSLNEISFITDRIHDFFEENGDR